MLVIKTDFSVVWLLFLEKEEIKYERIVKQQPEFIASIMDYPKLRDARKGAVATVELDTEGESSYFNSKGNDVCKWFLNRGVVLRPLGNVLIMIPSYCISAKYLDYIHQQIRLFLEG